MTEKLKTIRTFAKNLVLATPLIVNNPHIVYGEPTKALDLKTLYSPEYIVKTVIQSSSAYLPYIFFEYDQLLQKTSPTMERLAKIYKYCKVDRTGKVYFIWDGATQYKFEQHPVLGPQITSQYYNKHYELRCYDTKAKKAFVPKKAIEDKIVDHTGFSAYDGSIGMPYIYRNLEFAVKNYISTQQKCHDNKVNRTGYAFNFIFTAQKLKETQKYIDVLVRLDDNSNVILGCWSSKKKGFASYSEINIDTLKQEKLIPDGITQFKLRFKKTIIPTPRPRPEIIKKDKQNKK